MLKKLIKLAFLSALVIPNFVHANPGSWMPTAKSISSIIIEGNDDGKALILIEEGVPSEYIPSECRNGGNSIYNTIPLNTDKGRGMYSLALAAYASGKKIKLALSCAGNRPLITHIWTF